MMYVFVLAPSSARKYAPVIMLNCRNIGSIVKVKNIAKFTTRICYFHHSNHNYAANNRDARSSPNRASRMSAMNKFVYFRKLGYQYWKRCPECKVHGVSNATLGSRNIYKDSMQQPANDKNTNSKIDDVPSLP